MDVGGCSPSCVALEDLMSRTFVRPTPAVRGSSLHLKARKFAKPGNPGNNRDQRLRVTFSHSTSLDPFICQMFLHSPVRWTQITPSYLMKKTWKISKMSTGNMFPLFSTKIGNQYTTPPLRLSNVSILWYLKYKYANTVKYISGRRKLRFDALTVTNPLTKPAAQRYLTVPTTT